MLIAFYMRELIWSYNNSMREELLFPPCGNRVSAGWGARPQWSALQEWKWDAEPGLSAPRAPPPVPPPATMLFVTAFLLSRQNGMGIEKLFPWALPTAGPSQVHACWEQL